MPQADFSLVLADYFELVLDVPPVQAVTQELVLSRLVDLQYRMAEARPVKRPVRQQDRVLLDLYAFAGDLPIPGSLQTDLRTLVRDDMLVPDFCRQLLGMLPGQKKDMQLTLPADSELGTYAGQPVSFRVHLKQLEELRLPELDDRFAQRTGLARTLPELLNVLAQELHQECLAEWRKFITSTLVEAVVASSQVELAESLIAAEIENAWRSSEAEGYRQLGLSETFLNKSLSAWQNSPEQRQAAVARLRTTLVLHAIATQEQLGLSPDELAVVLAPLSERFAQPLAAIYHELAASGGLEPLQLQLEAEKASAFLFEHATLVFEGEPITV